MTKLPPLSMFPLVGYLVIFYIYMKSLFNNLINNYKSRKHYQYAPLSDVVYNDKSFIIYILYYTLIKRL